MICFPFHLSTISFPVLIVFPLPFFLISYIHFDFLPFQLDFDVCKFFLVQTFCLSFSSRSMFLLFQGLVVPWHSILTSLPAWSIGITTFGRIWIHYTFIIPGPMYMKTVLGFSIQKVLEGQTIADSLIISVHPPPFPFMHLSPLRSIILFTHWLLYVPPGLTF